jgi:leucyl aminopeptidase
MIPANQLLLNQPNRNAIPIEVVTAAALKKLNAGLAANQKAWLATHGFVAAPLTWLALPDSNGKIARIIVGAPAPSSDGFALGRLASLLPKGHYSFQSGVADLANAALGWCLEAYRYDPYRPTADRGVTLACPKSCDYPALIATVTAVFLARDLVNAPANLLGPAELAAASKRLAQTHGAKFTVTLGKTLEKNFPLIHHVGKASPRAPRLIAFTWGKPTAPKVTLVGKGVCFDTGGLDIKPSSGMLLMKKDMGGAANVLGLAHMIMAAKLNVRLRVLIPAVENAIAGNAFRPGDVFKTRKGLTVEIGNTDAEGRLVLCEALALADEEAPELMIDMATLTGAARVALGPDLPPFFTDDDNFAQDLAKAATATNDPLWRLPFWQPYNALFESPIADMNNSSTSGFAGSITAALFLQRFVEKAKTYVHFDIFAWTPNPKPGRPKGGEAQGIRALFGVLRQRYGK